jgi:hypothetical protein
LCFFRLVDNSVGPCRAAIMEHRIECLSRQELEYEATLRDSSVAPDDTVEDLANNLRGLIILD